MTSKNLYWKQDASTYRFQVSDPSLIQMLKRTPYATWAGSSVNQKPLWLFTIDTDKKEKLLERIKKQERLPNIKYLRD